MLSALITQKDMEPTAVDRFETPNTKCLKGCVYSETNPGTQPQEILISLLVLCLLFCFLCMRWRSLSIHCLHVFPVGGARIPEPVMHAGRGVALRLNRAGVQGRVLFAFLRVVPLGHRILRIASAGRHCVQCRIALAFYGLAGRIVR